MAVTGATLLGATGQTPPAKLLRLSLGAAWRPSAAALGAISGVVAGPAGSMGELTLVNATTLNVNPFVAIVQGSLSADQGPYEVPNDALAVLTLTGQHASQYRRSLIVVEVNDSQASGVASSATTDRARLYPLDGALSAVAPGALPALPANSVALGEVGIPPVGQAVTLTPYNPRTGTRGGILPVLADGSTIPGHDGAAPTHDGQMRWHPTLGLQVGVGAVWMPATPQLPRIDIYLTAQQAFFGGPYLMPWDGIYAAQTTPGLTGAGSIWQNEWYYVDMTARRQQVKRAGLYAFDCEVTTNDGATNQYIKLVDASVSGSATGLLISQHGGTAAFGMNKITGSVRFAAAAWVTQTLYTAQSARQDAPNLGLRSHFTLTRLSD